MKDLGKQLLIDVLKLDELGLVPLYEATGFFQAADEQLGQIVQGSIEGFVASLKETPMFVPEGSSEEFLRGAGYMAALVGKTLDDFVQITNDALAGSV